MLHTIHLNVMIVELVLVTRATRHTEALTVTNELHAVLVHPHQTYWVHMGENSTVESTCSHLTGQDQLTSHCITDGNRNG